jgi:hypothetical protein
VGEHRELHDMLVTQGAGVEGLHLAGDERPSERSCTLIEHAAILWLLWSGWAMYDFEGYFGGPSPTGKRHRLTKRTGLPITADTLIDALHAAVKREVGDGEDQGDWMANEPLDAEDYDPLGEEARDGK